jgi:hypothetical protein
VGGQIIKSGDPVEQIKQIKYTNLVVNSIMLQNVVDLTDVLAQMGIYHYPSIGGRSQLLYQGSNTQIWEV